MLALQTQIGKAVVPRISILVINILALDGSLTFGLRDSCASFIPGGSVLLLSVLGVVPVVLLLIVARVSRQLLSTSFCASRPWGDLNDILTLIHGV